MTRIGTVQRVAAVGIATGVMFALFSPSFVHAQFSSFGSVTNTVKTVLSPKLIGGQIEDLQPCESPPGIVLTVGEPAPGRFLLTATSRIYLYGMFFPDVWVLGLAEPAPTGCVGLTDSLDGFSVGGLTSGGGIADISLSPSQFGFSGSTLESLGTSLINGLGISFPHDFDDLDNLGAVYPIKLIGTSLPPGGSIISTGSSFFGI